MTYVFKRGDDNCTHTWSDEQSERRLDWFTWWRVCTQCGEQRATRHKSRGPFLHISDDVNGVSYVVGSRQNLAGREFRWLECECGNSVLVDFDLGDHGRVTRKTAVTCDWCGAQYPAGSGGPVHRPRSAFWKDAPEIE